jgi:hypothetical protein
MVQSRHSYVNASFIAEPSRKRKWMWAVMWPVIGS